MKIDALLFDGFDELDFFGVFETLRMAGLSVETHSLYQQDFVTAAYGSKLIPDAHYSNELKSDLLIVPGGGWISRSPKGAWAEVQKGTILDVVKSSHSTGTVIATVCTGSLVLGKSGLLKDRKATTNHGAVKELLNCGAKYIAARVVDDGDIITAAGITASLDLGLWLVERFVSRQAAQGVSEGLEFERRGIVYR
jgi:transcriptional regulator GlxA family with amidase domain